MNTLSITILNSFYLSLLFVLVLLVRILNFPLFSSNLPNQSLRDNFRLSPPSFPLDDHSLLSLLIIVYSNTMFTKKILLEIVALAGPLTIIEINLNNTKNVMSEVFQFVRSWIIPKLDIFLVGFICHLFWSEIINLISIFNKIFVLIKSLSLLSSFIINGRLHIERSDSMRFSRFIIYNWLQKDQKFLNSLRFSFRVSF